MKRVQAQSPSNIAIVKYMGKTSAEINLPANASLSLTLNHLASIAQIEQTKTLESGEVKLNHALPVGEGLGLKPPVSKLSEAGQERFVRHFKRCETKMDTAWFESFGLKRLALDHSKGVEIRCASRFPAGAGIASSASSFSALTLATAAYFASDRTEFEKAWEQVEFKKAVAKLSREGSGSSCRSLMGPWVEWQPTVQDESESEDTVTEIPSVLPELTDFVILVDQKEKKVSSSQAHERVLSSPLWNQRVNRATERLERIKKALSSNDRQTLAWEVWRESWEMHSLFHTASKPFTYWQPATLSVLEWLSGELERNDPPMVTLDAGPNIHCLVPSSEASQWRERIAAQFPQLSVLEDRQGSGASLIQWQS